MIDEFYTSDGRTIFVAIDNGDVVGAIGIDYADRSLGLIRHIAVLPGKQKQGVGGLCVESCVLVLAAP